jgi:hypothetical protein
MEADISILRIRSRGSDALESSAFDNPWQVIDSTSSLCVVRVLVAKAGFPFGVPGE